MMQHPVIILNNKGWFKVTMNYKGTTLLTRMPVKASWHFATQLPVRKIFGNNLEFLDLPVWWKAKI